MRQNFPSGAIDLEHASAPDLGSLTSDPADIHVCALALAAEVDYLFTHDRGYLRDALNDHGVQVLTPDEFLAPAFDSDSRGLLDVLKLQASAWTGGRPVGELLDAIERAGAPTFADKARRSLGL